MVSSLDYVHGPMFERLPTMRPLSKTFAWICVFLLATPAQAFDQFYSPETSTEIQQDFDYSPETAVPSPTPDPQFGNTWTIRDGRNVWDHLAQDHHAGKIIGDYRSLSYSQAHDLHSDLHNTGRTLNAADYGAPVQTVQVTAAQPTTLQENYTYTPETVGALGSPLTAFTAVRANCPNGQCPAVRQPVRASVRSVGATASRTVQRSRTVVRRGVRSAGARVVRPLRRWVSRVRARRGARRAPVRVGVLRVNTKAGTA
jgi:hypothetical protein